MIESFRSKDLRKFWTKGDAGGIRPDWRKRVTLILSALDVAAMAEEMNLPGFGFHRLSAGMADRYAVTVSRNWRITFGWSASNATEVDLEDYHGA